MPKDAKRGREWTAPWVARLEPEVRQFLEATPVRTDTAIEVRGVPRPDETTGDDESTG